MLRGDRGQTRLPAPSLFLPCPSPSSHPPSLPRLLPSPTILPCSRRSLAPPCTCSRAPRPVHAFSGSGLRPLNHFLCYSPCRWLRSGLPIALGCCPPRWSPARSSLHAGHGAPSRPPPPPPGLPPCLPPSRLPSSKVVTWIWLTSFSPPRFQSPAHWMAVLLLPLLCPTPSPRSPSCPAPRASTAWAALSCRRRGA